VGTRRAWDAEMTAGSGPGGLVDDDGEGPLAALQGLIREKDEEVRRWRIRCLQAEAEVRALKRGVCHTSDTGFVPEASKVSPVEPQQLPTPVVPAETGGGVCRGPLAEEVEDGELRASLELRAPGGAAAFAKADSLLDQFRRLTELKHGSDLRQTGELAELKRQLQSSQSTILQLQADFFHDKRQVERRCKTVESENIIRAEELREMSLRAEGLSEQVAKSRRRAGELRVARSEAAELRQDLDECEARLKRTQANYHRVARLRGGECNLEAEAEASIAAPSIAASASSGASPETWSARQEELLQCLATMQRLHVGLQGALQGARAAAAAVTATAIASGPPGSGGRGRSPAARRSRGPAVAPVPRPAAAAAPGSGAAAASGGGDGLLAEGCLAQMARQLEQARQLVEGAAEQPPTGPPSSPEGGESCQVCRRSLRLRLAAQEESLQQRLQECSLQAEEARQELAVRHCDELDRLSAARGRERVELQQEVRELRAACARAERGAAIAAGESVPWSAGQSEVAALRRELASQVQELREFRREEEGSRERDRLAAEQLRADFGRLRHELAASEDEFNTLANLYHMERREHLSLRQHCRELEELRAEAPQAPPGKPLLRQAAEALAGTVGGTGREVVHEEKAAPVQGPASPVDPGGMCMAKPCSPQATVATTVSPRELTPDNTTTEGWTETNCTFSSELRANAALFGRYAAAACPGGPSLPHAAAASGTSSPTCIGGPAVSTPPVAAESAAAAAKLLPSAQWPGSTAQALRQAQTVATAPATPWSVTLPRRVPTLSGGAVPVGGTPSVPPPTQGPPLQRRPASPATSAAHAATGMAAPCQRSPRTLPAQTQQLGPIHMQASSGAASTTTACSVM